jgi:5-methylcytosine-specific restriction endonuclease McrA
VSSKKDIRKKFKEEVYKRDGYTCKFCHFTYGINNSEVYLDAHHITDRNEMPNGGYVSENGISLCKDDCHMKAEKFHISGGSEWELGMHPDDLYKLIGSSKEIATKKAMSYKILK